MDLSNVVFEKVRCMTICVLATASSESGALTIYKQFLNALEVGGGDNDWHIFIADGMPTPTIDNVTYHVCQTKGWGRMYFDFFGFKQEILKNSITPNVVFSLQNTGVRCNAGRCVIYYHQPLPLFKYKINFCDKFAKTYIFYHFLYPLYVRLFINDNTYFAVQTNSIKKRFQKRFNLDSNRIGIYFPPIENIAQDALELYEFEDNTFNFFYPAIPVAYKEHISIAYAVWEMYQHNPEMAKRILIHFTLKKGEVVEMDKYIVENGLEQNFVYHGRIPHHQLLSMVKSSNGLLFPSMIETLGLPLLEAASLGVPVIANDLEYVHEVLSGYEGVKYVAVHDYKDWAEKILSCCSNMQYAPYVLPEDNSWERLIKLITEGIIENK